MLEDALESIPKEFEIIVADTGSTDQSIKIAKQYTPFVYSIQWNDDFSAARNYCSAQATGDYILVMDADERLPSCIYNVIELFVKEHPLTAGSVCIENIMKDGIKRHRMVRFYPNHSGFRWEGAIHEQIYIREKIAPAVPIDLCITHLGYEEEYYIRKEKHQRYLPMYLSFLKKFPQDGYMLYQLGKLYQSMGDLQNAEFYLRQSMDQKQTNQLFYPAMLVLLGYVLQENKKSTEAIELLKQVEFQYPKFPDLPFLIGILAMDTGDFQTIEKSFHKALSIGETNHYTTVEGVGSYKAAYNLGVFYEITGNHTKAVQYYMLAAESSYVPAIARLKLV